MNKMLNFALVVTVLLVIGCSGSTEPETDSNAPTNLDYSYHEEGDSLSGYYWQVDLIWDAPSEPDNDNFEYRIYKDDQFIETINNMQNYYTDVDCEFGEEYAYYVTAYYSTGESDASNILIVFIGSIPAQPYNPFPSNNALIYTDVVLSWDCYDPDGDTLTYDIYFGIEEDPPLVNSGQSETSYNPGTLNEDTQYFWKVVAFDEHENSITGDVWNFTVVEPVTDIDGNVYQTLIIGEQEWMVENLKVTHYRNGDAIPNVTSDTTWTVLSTGAYCIYDNNPTNGDTYGALYNWYAVDDPRGLAPEGWHIPTDEEIMELEIYLGMSYEEAHDEGMRGTNEGSKLADNAALWNDGDLENDPEFGSCGFDFLPGGYRHYTNGSFYYMSSRGYLWSSTEYYSDYAWNRKLYYYLTNVYRYYYYKRYGISVRCVRD